MSKDEQVIAALNSVVRLDVRPSKIHGVGVFAMRFIPEGTKLYANASPQYFQIAPGNVDKLLPDVKEQLVKGWPGLTEGYAFLYPDCLYGRFINHADDPNYDAKEDVTLKDIKEGEEITEDYRTLDGWEKAYPWLKKK